MMLRNQLILKIDKEIIYLAFSISQGIQKADEKFHHRSIQLINKIIKIRLSRIE